MLAGFGNQLPQLRVAFHRNPVQPENDVAGRDTRRGGWAAYTIHQQTAADPGLLSLVGRKGPYGDPEAALVISCPGGRGGDVILERANRDCDIARRTVPPNVQRCGGSGFQIGNHAWQRI